MLRIKELRLKSDLLISNDYIEKLTAAGVLQDDRPPSTSSRLKKINQSYSPAVSIQYRYFTHNSSSNL